MKYIITLLLTIVTICEFSQVCPTTKFEIDKINDESIPFIAPEAFLPNGNGPDTTTAPEYTGPRMVAFVHGIAASQNTWVAQRDYLSVEFNTFVPHIEYNHQSITDAAFDVNGTLRTANEQLNTQMEGPDGLGPSYDKSKSFIIAHSLGGIVARRLEHNHEEINNPNWSKEYNGLITFGTPHQGTYIANNSDLAVQWTQEGCELFSYAYFNEAISQIDIPYVPAFAEKFLTSFLKNTAFGEAKSKKFLDDYITNNGSGGIIGNGICNEGLNFLVGGKIAEMLPPIGEDMLPDSENMTELQNNSFDYPIITAYGIETTPVSLKQMFAATKNTNEDYPLWGADDELGEDEFEDIYEDILDRTYSKYEKWAMIPYWGDSHRDAFYSAYEWLSILDEQYRIIFDIDYIETNIVDTEIACKCETPGFEIIIDCEETTLDGPFGSLYELDCEEIEVPIYEHTIIQNESDAVVRANSSSALNHGNTFIPINMAGSNHTNMKNDLNTKFIFDTYLSPDEEFPIKTFKLTKL